jgi:hypothetical protein
LLGSTELQVKCPPVGRHRLATPRRRRWSAPAAAVALPALALVSVGADSLSATTHDAPSACCAELIAEPPAATQYRTTPADDGLLLAASRSMHRDLETALPPTVGSEAGLQVKTILVARAVSAIFPEIQSIGGVRPDALRWHPDGLAIDVMIPNPGTAEGIALGNQIVAFALKNADRFALQDCIWRGIYFTPGGARAGGYGHYDHVHITTKGGGYPTGGEVYYR